MNLEQLQRAMAAAVMQPLTRDEEMQSHDAAGRGMDEVASEFIKPNDRLTAFERLEIYNRQYWFRLQGTFAEDFPALRAVIGPERFEVLTNAYLEAHPSRSFSLRNLGSNLLEWLTSNPQWAGPQIALALDVVRVEWACIEAFDNAEYQPLNLAEISQLGADSKLTLQPHLQLLALSYPADSLVLELHQKQRRESSEAGTRSDIEDSIPYTRIRLRKRATWLAIHRADLSVYYKSLTRPEFLTLSALRNGSTLPDALEAGFEGSRMATATRINAVREWFTHWAELGWICRPEADTNSKLG
ncbi:HvfC/BufC N-terminal domain-containing protein [Acidicapsa ligni]|uniref:HvfC/BufC N-terminal domain-containing protein n=1 Tax=Acidicapsa ligni TaxID=542300 RepID=UPI0021E07555|nr:DNA-binding domain-containing protein [Acidicapsa ligni]